MAAHSLNHPASGRPPRTKLRPLQIQRPIDDTSLHMIPQNAQPLHLFHQQKKKTTLEDNLNYKQLLDHLANNNNT